MPDVSALTLAFIDRQPATAARILAANPGADAGALVSAIPTRYACKLLASLSTPLASKILQQADAPAGAAIIQELEYSEAVAILRHLGPAGRENLLTDVPRILRNRLERSLRFAANSVGALMTTNINVLSISDTCAMALQLIRQDSGSRCDVVFIQDNDRTYRGTVRLLSMLRRPDNSPLIDLVDASAKALSAHASLEKIAKLPEWHDFTTLPVVARKGNVIGALNRRAVEASNALSQSAGKTPPGSVLREITYGMTDCASSLLELLLPARPAKGKAGSPDE